MVTGTLRSIWVVILLTKKNVDEIKVKDDLQKNLLNRFIIS